MTRRALEKNSARRSDAQKLMALISRFPARQKLSEQFRIKNGTRSQKQHWMLWLAERDGAGYYKRKVIKPQPARIIYNRIHCAPMLFWLAEAAGVSRSSLSAAFRTLPAMSKDISANAARIRKHIPWQSIRDAIEQKTGVRFD